MSRHIKFSILSCLLFFASCETQTNAVDDLSNQTTTDEATTDETATDETVTDETATDETTTEGTRVEDPAIPPEREPLSSNMLQCPVVNAPEIPKEFTFEGIGMVHLVRDLGHVDYDISGACESANDIDGDGTIDISGPIHSLSASAWHKFQMTMEQIAFPLGGGSTIPTHNYLTRRFDDQCHLIRKNVDTWTKPFYAWGGAPFCWRDNYVKTFNYNANDHLISVHGNDVLFDGVECSSYSNRDFLDLEYDAGGSVITVESRTNKYRRQFGVSGRNGVSDDSAYIGTLLRYERDNVGRVSTMSSSTTDFDIFAPPIPGAANPYLRVSLLSTSTFDYPSPGLVIKSIDKSFDGVGPDDSDGDLVDATTRYNADAFGRIISIQEDDDADGTVENETEYQYNSLHQLTRITENGVVLRAFEFTADHKLLRQQNPDGSTLQLKYTCP